jgi:hypothetical protein
VVNEGAEKPSPAEVLRTIIETELREFLQSSPLYRRVKLQLVNPAMQVDFPEALSMPCPDPACKAQPTTTWRLLRTEAGLFGPGQLIAYVCAHCGRMRYSFWVVTVPGEQARKSVPHVQSGPALGVRVGPLAGFRAFTLFKIGQYPSWSITPAKEVERALSPEDLELYKNGLVCMSQAYGIGALGYFRRVVENAVSGLLDLVEEAAQTDGDTKALAAVEAARLTKIADEKLKLVADVVPASLRPGGVNPLATLYADYSRGLHALSDKECLEVATDMRDALDYVFGNLRDRLEQAKAYRDKMTKRTRS